jgi:DNA-binding MarR family transcriptional regulator
MHSHIVCVRILSVQLYHQAVVRKDSRPDLAEMLAELARKTVAAEQPVLAAHGLSMWGYIVLSALDRSPIRTQAALAQAIGADKTRIIPTLDELQQQGYIERVPDPDDRRARLLEITESGRSIKNTVQLAIQRGEEHWLGRLSANDRDAFLRALQQLSGRSAD